MDAKKRAELAEAIRQEKLPKVCRLHPKEVWYDGKCPACALLRENVLTRARKKMSMR